MATERAATVLDAARLLADAEIATSLDDWGGESYFEKSFRTLFQAMAESLTGEANLTPAGLAGAQLRLQAMAEARLQFIDDRKRWPGIVDEAIIRPIFILGLPRAGSTFLHSLLAQDPANRNPQTWEMLFPSPPPELASYQDDARIERAQGIWRALGLERPEVTALHPFNARLAEECHHLMELMCLGDSLPGLWRVPSFNKARAAADLREGYLTHRMALQNLQHRFRGERWVLKNPGHVFYLDHLLSVYPDAQIIQTHRDPVKVIPSVAALLLALRQGASNEAIAGEKIAMGNMRAFARGLDAAIEFRRRPDMEAHFHDVHFLALTSEPMRTVDEIYRRFGLTLSPAAEARMCRWLENEPRHAVSGRFTPAQFGLDEAQIDHFFGRYMRHYGVAAERARQ